MEDRMGLYMRSVHHSSKTCDQKGSFHKEVLDWKMLVLLNSAISQSINSCWAMCAFNISASCNQPP